MHSLKMISRKKLWVCLFQRASVNLVSVHNIKLFNVCVYINTLCFCDLLQLKRWILGRPRRARVCRRRTLLETSTTTKPNASLTTSHQTLSPGDYVTFAFCLLWDLSGLSSSTIYLTFLFASSEEPPGRRRKSWTWKPLECLAASWEAEDSGAEGAEGRAPLSSDPSQKLTVGGCEGCSFSLSFCWYFSVNIVVFYLFKKVPPFFPHLKIFLSLSQIGIQGILYFEALLYEMGEQFVLIKQLYARGKCIHWQLVWYKCKVEFVFDQASRHIIYFLWLNVL